MAAAVLRVLVRGRSLLAGAVAQPSGPKGNVFFWAARAPAPQLYSGGALRVVAIPLLLPKQRPGVRHREGDRKSFFPHASWFSEQDEAQKNNSVISFDLLRVTFVMVFATVCDLSGFGTLAPSGGNDAVARRCLLSSSPQPLTRSS